GRAAQPAPVASQRLAGAPLGRPGLSAGLPLVRHRTLLASADRPAARAADDPGRGAVAPVRVGRSALFPAAVAVHTDMTFGGQRVAMTTLRLSDSAVGRSEEHTSELQSRE